MILFGTNGDLFAATSRPGIVLVLLDLTKARPEADSRKAIDVVEFTRQHVLRALEVTVCGLPTNDTLAHNGVSTWGHVGEISGHDGLDLLDKLSRLTCARAAMGAASVAAWRALASCALAYRDNLLAWQAVTDQAETVIKLTRWIYGGGYGHTFGES